MMFCSYRKKGFSSFERRPVASLHLRGDAADLAGHVAGKNVLARDFARRADLVASEHGARARDVFQDAARPPLRKIVGDERDGAGAADDRKRRQLSAEALFDEAERGATERERREPLRRERTVAPMAPVVFLVLRRWSTLPDDDRSRGARRRVSNDLRLGSRHRRLPFAGPRVRVVSLGPLGHAHQRRSMPPPPRKTPPAKPCRFRW